MQGTGYKRCSKCGEEKAVEEFHLHRRDGRQSRCKSCQRAENRERYRMNRDAYREKNKRWHRSNQKRKSEARKHWEEENPDRALGGRERYKHRHPAKARAGQAVRNAVHRGTLVKPDSCERCGGPSKPRELHGHHRDYDKPLEVEWLCRSCHQAEHKRRLSRPPKGTGSTVTPI